MLTALSRKGAENENKQTDHSNDVLSILDCFATLFLNFFLPIKKQKTLFGCEYFMRTTVPPSDSGC
jgi:hypothetical protein